MARESMILAAWRLNKKFPLLILLLLLLNLAAYGIISYWIAPRLSAAEREYIDGQALIGQLRQAGASTETPQKIFLQSAEELVAFREAVPPKTELSALVGEIFALAEAVGLGIDQVSYDPQEVEGRDMLRYSLLFSVTGDYGQVKKLVFALEQSPRLFSIDSLSLSGQSGPDAGQVSLNLRLSTLFRTDVL